MLFVRPERSGILGRSIRLQHLLSGVPSRRGDVAIADDVSGNPSNRLVAVLSNIAHMASRACDNNMTMMPKTRRQQTPEVWRELAERASLEQDQAKRMELSQQFNRVLAQDEASERDGQ
jgi:hypothetical protein